MLKKATWEIKVISLSKARQELYRRLNKEFAKRMVAHGIYTKDWKILATIGLSMWGVLVILIGVGSCHEEWIGTKKKMNRFGAILGSVLGCGLLLIILSCIVKAVNV